MATHGHAPRLRSCFEPLRRHRLLESYCTFVFDNPELIQVLVSETQHLPEPERQRTRVAQHAYIAERVNLVREVHPEWELPYARVRVQALRTMMNDVALTAQLHRYPHVQPASVTIGCALLDINSRPTQRRP